MLRRLLKFILLLRRVGFAYDSRELYLKRGPTPYPHKSFLLTETCTGIRATQPVLGQRGEAQHRIEMMQCSQTHNIDVARQKPLLILRTITKLGTWNVRAMLKAGRARFLSDSIEKGTKHSPRRKHLQTNSRKL